jgi:L-iditol 2-dehydrogenase
MRSLLFNAPDDVELVDAPVPDAPDDRVLVRIEASAICGSELHAPAGWNPGHEGAGVVERAPDGCGYDVGDRVGVSAVVGCTKCEQCRKGEQLFCDEGPRYNLAMHADYVAVEPSALRRMPDGISARDAVLISGDTLGVPVRAFRRLPTSSGDRVLVIGLGPIGLGHTLLRAHEGAEVIAIEPSEYRRELAMKLGASTVFEPGEDFGPAPDFVIECTGIPACIHQAFDAVAPRGTVLQSGECDTPIEVNPSELFIRREIIYTGGWYYSEADFPEMVRRYQDGLPVDRMVTHEFPADEIADAYATFVSKRSGKVMIDWT